MGTSKGVNNLVFINLNIKMKYAVACLLGVA